MSVAAVREATVEDATAIAAVQLTVWRTVFAEFLPAAVVDGLNDDAVATSWAQAVGTPGDAHVLVALEGTEVTGFAAGSGGEVATLLVDPRWGRRGHGGRLLGTLAERLHAGGAQRAQVWVAEDDEASRRFFTRHGWPADATVRTSHHGAQVLRERRHTGSLLMRWE